MHKIDLNTINWSEIQKKHNGGIYWNNLSAIVNLSRTTLERAAREGYIVKIRHKPIMSIEAKQKISKERIKYLKENPEKHPWKSNDKFKSKPCELLKNKLNENNIIYISEYEPSNERYYSIDIAFPNKKIGIEINGNQHYNKDGTLKDYYKKRNDFLISIGWKIYDIHYSIVYKDFLLKTLINDIKIFSLSQNEFDFYSNEYFKRKNFKKEIVKKEIVKKQKIRENNERNKKIELIKENLLLSNINFSKFGWVNEASKIINWKPNAVNRWMKKYMPEFYKNCFKRQRIGSGNKRKYGSKEIYLTIKFNENNIKNKEKIIFINNSNINFSKFGWVNEASKIIKCKPQHVGKWMKRYMPEFYEKCYKRKKRPINSNE